MITALVDLGYHGVDIFDPQTRPKWWLSGSGEFRHGYAYIATVDLFGNTHGNEVEADNDEVYVRPALVYSRKSGEFVPGTRISVLDVYWIVIPGGIMVCESPIGCVPFREDDWEEDACDYEASDVKRWLDEWFRERAHASSQNNDQ